MGATSHEGAWPDAIASVVAVVAGVRAIDIVESESESVLDAPGAELPRPDPRGKRLGRRGGVVHS